jgi:hypothetical protein
MNTDWIIAAFLVIDTMLERLECRSHALADWLAFVATTVGEVSRRVTCVMDSLPLPSVGYCRRQCQANPFLHQSTTPGCSVR